MQKPCGDEVLSYECPLYGSFDRQQFRFRLWASTSYPVGLRLTCSRSVLCTNVCAKWHWFGMTLIKQISVALSNHADGFPDLLTRRCFEQRSSVLVRAESQTVHPFSGWGLQLHFGIQARHRTRGPTSLKKGTSTVAFREFGNKCGTIAGKVIL
jgi:hypothetical protein